MSNDKRQPDPQRRRAPAIPVVLAYWAGVVPPNGDLEQTVRDAKGWLSKVMTSGYSPSKDQEPLTRLIDLDVIRSRQLRSFRRIDSAVSQLVETFRTGQHILTPSPD